MKNSANNKRDHGDCRVPARWKENRKLASWVISQRYDRRKRGLRKEWEDRLNGIGFEWDLISPEATWKRWFDRLKAFKVLNGHCHVSRSNPKDEALASWVTEQRRLHAQAKLDRTRKARLDDLSFDWKSAHDSESRWNTMFERLCAFREAKGHVRVFPSWSDKTLGRWVLKQRKAYRDRKLSLQQIQKLESIGFGWTSVRREKPATDARKNAGKKSWDEYFVELGDYFKNFGDCNVPENWPINRPLARWVVQQRKLRRAKRLPPEQERRLANLGFEWGIYDANWERMLVMLAEFAREHGHCRVPSKWKDNLPLAKWVEGQRRKKKAERLLPQRIAALEKLGFEWRVSTYDPQPRVWNEMFERLKKYKELHGDCIVPQRYREDRQLAGWVSEQRMANNRGELTSERVQLLTDLGFDWNPIVTKWDEMFAALVEYKKQHGDVNVPQKSREYPKLAAWVAKQRYDKKKNKPISPPRARRLDELGFVWAFKDPFSWEHMFALLVDYKKDHGDCKVPQNWRANKQLGKWVNTQRTHYKRGKLRPDRLRQLEELSFVWNNASDNTIECT